MENNRDVFAKNLTMYMAKFGKTQREMADLIGVASSTFNEWCKGKKYPRMDKIEWLANYFGILKSDLIEEKTEEHREMQEKNGSISAAVIRMQTDDVFLSAVESLYKLDQKKLSSILTLLD